MTLGGETIPLKQILELMEAISGRRARRLQIGGRVAEIATAMLEFAADHVTRRPPSGTTEGVRIALRAEALSIKKSATRAWLRAKPRRTRVAGDHCASA
jgi:dihydroflavonol-4-reductase